jgi:hypothetical protein
MTNRLAAGTVPSEQDACPEDVKVVVLQVRVKGRRAALSTSFVGTGFVVALVTTTGDGVCAAAVFGFITKHAIASINSVVPKKRLQEVIIGFLPLNIWSGSGNWLPFSMP